MRDGACEGVGKSPITAMLPHQKNIGFFFLFIPEFDPRCIWSVYKLSAGWVRKPRKVDKAGPARCFADENEAG